MNRKCKFCNKIFETNSSTREYCNVDCKKKAEEERKKDNLKNKICITCKERTTISPFSKYCNVCRIKNLKEGYKKKLNWQKKYQKEYHERKRNDFYYKKKRNERFKIYWRKRFDEDSQFRIAQRLRNLLYQALKKYTITGKSLASNKYGIDYKQIIKKLQPFPKEINKYHIDHIRPLSSFNLEDPKEIKKAFAPANLQWLLSSENIKKGNKIIKVSPKDN